MLGLPLARHGSVDTKNRAAINNRETNRSAFRARDRWGSRHWRRGPARGSANRALQFMCSRRAGAIDFGVCVRSTTAAGSDFFKIEPAHEEPAHVYPTCAPLSDLTIAPAHRAMAHGYSRMSGFVLRALALYILACVIRHQRRGTEAQNCAQEYIKGDGRGGLIHTEQPSGNQRRRTAGNH
jgi:hypothetical protein